MKQKYKIKKGDEVEVVAGAEKGKTGKVLSIRNDRVVVEKVALRKKHQKPSQENQEGAIVEIEGSIHYSNIKKIN
jgi:large subunit ribosomal protein L24